MITDRQTNKLYLAECLKERQPTFFPRFEIVLNECNIQIHWLKNTKDIWAVDYMTIQISKEKFVQFRYNPDYLQLKKYQKTISDVDSICKVIPLTTQKSNLVVDGGNVIKAGNKVIMCDKVFAENKKINEKDLIKQLKELFQIDKLFFVPWDTDDYTGHADGMVRFINDETVLINKYWGENPEFERCF